MQILEVKVDDNYLDEILEFLKSKKEVKDIKVKDKVEYESWSLEEINNIGKIGFVSSSFVEDSEDYSKW